MHKKHIFIFAVLAIVIFALGTQLATAKPMKLEIGNTEISLFPLILTTKAADAPSGVLYIFSSSITTDGGIGSRSEMNDICPSEIPDSHFCRLEEIENAWVTTGVYFENYLPESWVEYFSDSVGNWSQANDNCEAWTRDTGDYSGMAILAGAQLYARRDCSQSLSIACCKQIP